MATASDKGTPIGLTQESSLLENNVFDKGTPIGMKEDSSENAEPNEQDSDARAQDSE